MIEAVSAIVINNKKMLATRNRGLDVLFIPGGKIENGEMPQDALVRELREELGSGIKSCKYYDTFVAQAHMKNDKVRSRSFFVELEDSPVASSEVEELVWLDKNNYTKLKLGNILVAMIPRLVSQGYL